MKQLILNNQLTLLEIISSTGLQIKTDPGIPIIYLGIFLFNDKYINKLYYLFTNLDYSKKSKNYLLVEIQIVLFLNLN
jgi:hypothetical protein